MTRTKAAWWALILAGAAAAYADMGFGGGGMVPQPLVASDGAVLVLAPTPAYQETPAHLELHAYNPDGSLRFRYPIFAGVRALATAGSLVFVATAGGNHQAEEPNQGAGSLVALQLANGVEVWGLSLPGVAQGLSLAGDRLYVVVGSGMGVEGGTNRGSMGGGMGGMHGPWRPSRNPQPPQNASENHRRLLAVSLAGALLWQVDLNP